MNSIVQDWAAKLPLRYQGALMGGIRGCDTLAKNDPAKRLTRLLRGVILKAQVGDPRRAKSFIEWTDDDTSFLMAIKGFHDSWDGMPHHFVMHFLHAAEIVGFHHDDEKQRFRWDTFYRHAVHKLHLNPETKAQLEARLMASEEDFNKEQYDV